MAVKACSVPDRRSTATCTWAAFDPSTFWVGRHDAGIQHEDEFLTFIGLHPDVMDLFIGEREGLIGELCAHRGQDST